MLKIFLSYLLFAGVLVFGGPVFSADTIRTGNGVTTERWDGKVLTASFRAGMCFEKNGKARGVLILRHANGNEDTYHLYGHMRDNTFDLSHSSGHHFHGRLLSPTKMEGSAKIKNGPTLSLSGKRTLNVPLVAEDCAPLPK